MIPEQLNQTNVFIGDVIYWNNIAVPFENQPRTFLGIVVDFWEKGVVTIPNRWTERSFYWTWEEINRLGILIK